MPMVAPFALAGLKDPWAIMGGSTEEEMILFLLHIDIKKIDSAPANTTQSVCKK